MLSPAPPSSETAINLPETQQSFLSELVAFQAQAGLSPNSLALQELLKARDAQIAALAPPEDWSGLVLGVQSVQGKGGISIDIGGVNILAGVHLSYGLDTLVSPSQSTAYNELLTLQRGDKVTFSGDFATYKGSAVEMSYSGQNSVLNPEFLFSFRSLTSE
jgi:hypothetical protein